MILKNVKLYKYARCFAKKSRNRIKMTWQRTRSSFIYEKVISTLNPGKTDKMMAESLGKTERKMIGSPRSTDKMRLFYIRKR